MIVGLQGKDATILTTGPARFWGPFFKGAKQMLLCFFNALRVLNRKAVWLVMLKCILSPVLAKKA